LNCDRIARWYRRLEYAGFGHELERRRCAFLKHVASARSILTLGEGDGRFLARLVDQNPNARLDYVDQSGRMLELARDRAANRRVTYHQVDAQTMALPRDGYDLIVTHFFLDCFDQAAAEALVQRIAAAGRPDARWLISEFRQPERGWRAAWAWIWLRILYLFFRWSTGLRTNHLVDHHPLLARQGFHLARTESARFGLLASELWTREPANS
jgi:ubiquinone/menaquinone biosynthesis C-methylase UbiE